MEKTLNILKKSIPYVILFCMTFASTYLIFYDGVPYGADLNFHFANIYDKYKTMLDGHTLSGISGNIGTGIGVGGGLFYSPFSHTFIAIVALIFNLFGGTVLNAYKVCVFASVFVSGVFMFRFAMHFTKNNTVASILSGVCYILFPYRLFNLFCRIAVAEAFGTVFIPLFLMGLYDITHIDKDEVKILPFCEVILGGALLYLTHNITAVYTFIFGAFYLLLNIKKIVILMKNKKYTAYAFSSVVLLIGIFSIALFTQLELMNMDMYNITDQVKMWTDAETVASNAGMEWGSSGFLNTSYLYEIGVNGTGIITKILVFIMSCVLFIVVMKLLEKYKQLKYWDLLIASLVQILVTVTVRPHFEIYVAYLVFVALNIFLYCTKKEEENERKIYNSTMFWASFLAIIVCFIAMESKEIWLNAPKFLLNIQFPWRIWSIVQICVSILIGVIVHHYASRKNLISCLVIAICVLIPLTQPLIEKRVTAESGKEGTWHHNFSEYLIDDARAQGHNREYAPSVLTDSNYKSQYEASLHKYISKIAIESYYQHGHYYYKPVFLKGVGNINVTSAFAPKYEMEISANESGLIQMPLMYYPGYKITLENVETGEKIKLKGENIDGLVSFEMPQGNYIVKTKFEGTLLRKISVFLTIVSVIVVVFVIVYETVLVKRNVFSKCYFKKEKKSNGNAW